MKTLQERVHAAVINEGSEAEAFRVERYLRDAGVPELLEENERLREVNAELPRPGGGVMDLDRLEQRAKEAVNHPPGSNFDPSRQRPFLDSGDAKTVLALIDRLRKAERLMREDRCPQCGLWHRDSPRVRAFLDREEGS